MRKNLNTEHIEGRVYEHELAIKAVSNTASKNFGKEFIAGTLDIATDEEGLNVVQVHFTFVTETTSKGNKNSTYTALKKIIDEGKCWLTDGKDAATKVKIDTALALNDFFTQDDTHISVKQNEGGFVTIINELCAENERNTFMTDILITDVKHIDANPEKNIAADYVSVRGAVFNFKNDILPVEFVVKNPAGMKYFEDLDAAPSNPIYTKVWGRIVSESIEVQRTEESAFGEASVSTSKRNVKEWVVTGTAKVPYDFGDEQVMTVDEVTKAMQDREVMLAERKKQSQEYRASKAASASSGAVPPTATVANTGGFNF